MRPTRLLMLNAIVTAVALLASACAGPGSTRTQQQVRSQANPAERAQRTITNFTPALRCMDDKLFQAGVRDVTLMMEEMRDGTQRVPVATRDMMTSAFSEMTRRSRAVKLSLFGSDQQNLSQLLQQAQRANIFQAVPEFALRGAVSQVDDDLRREGGSLGVTAGLFGLRVGSETKVSMLGFDAAMVRTENFTLVPGVSSRNSTVLVRQDSSASDGQARLQSGAAVFAFTATRSEGQAQAARNMVELAAVELVGKLVRLPYWQCLGTPDDDTEVRRELDDWFLAMDEDERTVFLKERLRERRWYDGALDARRDEAFAKALAAYRRALGLADDGPMDLDFFIRFVTRAAPTGPLARPGPRSAQAPAAQAALGVQQVAAVLPTADAQAAAGTKPNVNAVGSSPAMSVVPVDPVAAGATGGGANSSKPVPIGLKLSAASRGQVTLELRASTPGYVYCYAQDPATHALRRIFPNRFVRDPRVEPDRPIQLPGRARVSLPAHQQYACVHALREVYGDLPAVLRWGDFEEIRLRTFDEIRDRFAESSGGSIALVRAAPTTP